MTPLTTDLPPSTSTAPIPVPPTPSWKNEVTARVRAHRTRRSPSSEDQPALPGLENALGPSTIAARVAERYARVPSYRDVLAAQAAAAEAEAAAEARGAARAAISPTVTPTLEPSQEPLLPDEPVEQPWQPDLLRYFVSTDSLPPAPSTPAEARVSAHRSVDMPETGADPLEDAVVEPAHPLPARVLAFPRELIAPRKARPRRAEGPLREDSSPQVDPAEARQELPTRSDSDPGELRIFEAEPARPPLSPAQDPPEWLSIHLDAETSMPPMKQSARNTSLDDLPLRVAPLGHRAMAGLVDFSLTLAAFLLFIVVFAASTTHLPSGRVALIGSGAILLIMWVLYQFLFFTLTDATPGMRYAKIALCTFDDENPARSAMRGRIVAMLLSALPLGLGFLWALFDEDTLGWHDRITRTYQRSYRPE
ncbi:MAG: RDD family protein [Acidobacteriaceae bacterium]